MTKRCSWVKMTNRSISPIMMRRGPALHDDQALFELLCMETYQEALSWETVLNKRQAFREAFHGYQIHAVAEMTNTELKICWRIQPSFEIEPRFLLHALTPKPFYGYRQNMALLMPIFGLC